MSKDDKQISKYLSFVLRHKPKDAGITLDDAGWVPVDELLPKIDKKGYPVSFDRLCDIVANNDKKRFEFNEDKSLIRASQGHTIKVDLGYSPVEPPEILYHGTALKNLDSIRSKGLVKGNRHHVHLSQYKDTALAVGQRYGKPVLLEILAVKMHADGYVFNISTNSVWLTDSVPMEYIQFPE